MAEGFTCEVDEDYRSACEGLDFYGEHEGKRYCVLHFPGEGKREDFEQVKKSKLADPEKNYDFSGTIFPEGTSDFEGTEFDGNAIFYGAIFSGDARFYRAPFSGKFTDFRAAHFSGKAIFSYAKFSGERTDFINAKFGSTETSLVETGFAKEVAFSGATFGERIYFVGTAANLVFGPQAQAWFDDSRIPKQEQVTFHTVLLHPGWFINTDVRKVDFTDVKWYGMPGGVPEGTLDEEIGALKERNVESPYTLLAQTCRRLSANAEDNREYPLANEFHYWSMDALRKQGWRSLGLIGTLYWALSGYGVRAARAFWAMVVIWAAFATFYMLVNPSEFKDFGQGISYFWRAAVYSLLAMSRLNPEPKPDEPGLFQFLVGLEGTLGPLQIALLALAIRRQVMR